MVSSLFIPKPILLKEKSLKLSHVSAVPVRLLGGCHCELALHLSDLGWSISLFTIWMYGYLLIFHAKAMYYTDLYEI